MPRTAKKLSALEVGRISQPGKHPVGESLYLQVTLKGTKSWLFRFAIKGKTTWMGLGPIKLVSLAEARSKVTDLQRQILAGENPLQKKIESLEIQRLELAKKVTFAECAKRYIEAHAPKWQNEKHIQQWRATIETYANPVIGNLAVQDIDTTLVIKVLEPVWYSKSETASRLRGRIEKVLSWSAVRGYRNSENPARWKGHLDQLLPKRSDVQKTEHFEALPFQEMGAFMQKLRASKSIPALALEFVILTATRTTETLEAKWSEINETEGYWLIPAERMKAKKEHKVPLSTRALEILREMKAISQSEYVFPGRKTGSPLSNTSMLMTLRRMNVQVTTHGFRSTFRDWASERTNFPTEVVEMALAHTIKNKVEAAYRRGDLFLKRQKLMNTWAEYCSLNAAPATVLDLNSMLSSEFEVI